MTFGIENASRVLIAGILAVSIIGCGHSYGHRSGHIHHHGGGGDAVALVGIGVFVGAAIVASQKDLPRDEPPPYVTNTYYVYGQPPAPLPRSSRDEVKTNEGELPAFNPQAARTALNGADVSSCREEGAPVGLGHAKVTINPDGRVSKVVVDEPANLSPTAAKCVGDHLGAITVPQFRGSLITMGTTYNVR